jgi:uncharacterized Tic20 family protein
MTHSPEPAAAGPRPPAEGPAQGEADRESSPHRRPGGMNGAGGSNGAAGHRPVPGQPVPGYPVNGYRPLDYVMPDYPASPGYRPAPQHPADPMPDYPEDPGKHGPGEPSWAGRDQPPTAGAGHGRPPTGNAGRSQPAVSNAAPGQPVTGEAEPGDTDPCLPALGLPQRGGPAGARPARRQGPGKPDRQPPAPRQAPDIAHDEYPAVRRHRRAAPAAPQAPAAARRPTAAHPTAAAHPTVDLFTPVISPAANATYAPDASPATENAVDPAASPAPEALAAPANARAAAWPGPSGGAGARLAMLAYLTVPIFGPAVPFAVYLCAFRRSPWLRAHAAQALNVWLTAVGYGVSAAIMGAMLALDAPQVAVIVIVPLVLVQWLVTLAFLVRAATAASQGRGYGFPRWLCSRFVR